MKPFRDPDDPKLQRDCAERLLALAAERQAAIKRNGASSAGGGANHRRPPEDI